MKIDVVTIFPDYLQPVRQSLPGKAIEAGLVDVAVHDLRRWTHDVHKSVDDSPYGGGPGMVMKPTVWGDALDEICTPETLLVVPTPAGYPFTQESAHQWSTEDHLVIACGRYEGIDQRVADDAATRMRVREVSIGDYVLNGGEVAALVIIEAVLRLIPGVLTYRFDGEFTITAAPGQPPRQHRTDGETLVWIVSTDFDRQLAGDAVRLGDTPDHKLHRSYRSVSTTSTRMPRPPTPATRVRSAVAVRPPRPITFPRSSGWT